MTFLNFFDLRLQTSVLSTNISNDLILSILNDNQFQKYNYDYGILYIIDVIFPTTEIAIEGKSLNEIENWCHNFINQLSTLSLYQYTNEDLLIFEKLLLYKILLESMDLNLRDEIRSVHEQYFDDIKSILNLSINEDNSVWLAQNKLRILCFRLFRNLLNFIQKNITFFTVQLEIAQENENKVKELETNILQEITFIDS